MDRIVFETDFPFYLSSKSVGDLKQEIEELKGSTLGATNILGGNFMQFVDTESWKKETYEKLSQ